jgi:TetR/AcrR family transcriptional regulator, cholesterol catabolism regulator
MSGRLGRGDAMPVRRRDMAEWRRQRILDAALQVFGRKGVDGASMKEVAAAAGVVPGLLYHYFTSKEALSLAVTVERGFLPELRELLTGAQQRPAAVVLPEVTAGFDRMLSQRSALVGLFIYGASNPKIRDGLEEVMRETHRLLGTYLADRVTAGELRPHDSRAVVQALFSSCAFGHIIGQPVDPLAVAQIVLKGIAVGR